MLPIREKQWPQTSYDPIRRESDDTLFEDDNESAEHPPKASSPSPPNPKGIHWRAPTLMVASFLAGTAFALLHHFYYSWLGGQQVPPPNLQEWPIRLGSGFMFLVKSTFTAAVGTAYIQHIYTVFRKRPLSVRGIDSAFAAADSILKLASWELIRKVKAGFLLGLIVWFVFILLRSTSLMS